MFIVLSYEINFIQAPFFMYFTLAFAWNGATSIRAFQQQCACEKGRKGKDYRSCARAFFRWVLIYWCFVCVWYVFRSSFFPFEHSHLIFFRFCSLRPYASRFRSVCVYQFFEVEENRKQFRCYLRVCMCCANGWNCN